MAAHWVRPASSITLVQKFQFTDKKQVEKKSKANNYFAILLVFGFLSLLFVKITVTINMTTNIYIFKK